MKSQIDLVTRVLGILIFLMTLSAFADDDIVLPSPSQTPDLQPSAVFSEGSVDPIEQLNSLKNRLEQVEQTNKALNQRVHQLEMERSAEQRMPSDQGEGRYDREGSPIPGRRPVSARESAGVESEGTSGRTFVREFDSGPIKRKAKVTFAEGLEFASEDDQFRLTFHNLTQVDFRGFPAAGISDNLNDQFFIPRQRWYFTGQATKAVEFYTVVNRGYGSIDLLDAFVTLNVLETAQNKLVNADGSSVESGEGAQGGGGRAANDRGIGNTAALRLRLGRMKTPYLYEYFAISEGDLIAPERSLYAANFAGNRKEGAMILGELFEKRVSYALGVFNGARRSFGDTASSNKDVYFYLNTRPFLTTNETTWFNYLNVGGSVNGGAEKYAVQPDILTTANDQSSPSNDSVVQSLSPTFLKFNPGVMEQGDRLQWAVNLDWFHDSFLLLSEYAAGYGTYVNNSNVSTRLPYSGWMVQSSYFVTGEKMTRRVNVVRPRRPFGVHNGVWGPGAIEVHGRYSNLQLGNEVYSGGLADQNLWANRADAIDIGVNWYWNYYTKLMVDWQHATYDQSVSKNGTATGRFSNSNDLLWFRLQLFF